MPQNFMRDNYEYAIAHYCDNPKQAKEDSPEMIKAHETLYQSQFGYRQTFNQYARLVRKLSPISQEFGKAANIGGIKGHWKVSTILMRNAPQLVTAKLLERKLSKTYLASIPQQKI